MPMPQPTRRPLSVLVAAALLASLAACGGPVRVEQSAAEGRAGGSVSDRMAFWHGLQDKAVVTHDAAFHALLLFFHGHDEANSYAQRRARVKQLGWVPEDFDQPGDAAIDRGTLAVALARGLKIEGGVMMNLLGATPRYATRELEHLGIYTRGSAQQVLTGATLAGIIARAEDYMDEHQKNRSRRLAKARREAVRVAASRGRTNSWLAGRADGGGSVVPGAGGATAAVVAQATRAGATTQPAAKAPATRPAQGEKLEIRIEAVQGMAQVRAAEDKPWRRAKEGMLLPRTTQVRTGPRSKVRIGVGDNQSIVLDRMGTIQVLDALKKKGAVEANVGMEYGRATLELDVEAGGIEHQSQIKSPSATLAVRGSRGYLQEDAGRKSPVIAGADRGDVAWRNVEGKWVDLSPGAVQKNDDTASGDRLARKNNNDGRAFARSGEEHDLRGDHANGFFQYEKGEITTFRDYQVRDASRKRTHGGTKEGGFENVGGTGALRGQLVWSNSADLDLHFNYNNTGIVPGDVYFGNPTKTFSDANGNQATAKLDRDNLGNEINVQPDKRVENIRVRIDDGKLPRGEYEFFVKNLAASQNPPDTGKLGVDTDGDGVPDRGLETQLQNGEVSEPVIVTIPRNANRTGQN